MRASVRAYNVCSSSFHRSPPAHIPAMTFPQAKRFELPIHIPPTALAHPPRRPVKEPSLSKIAFGTSVFPERGHGEEQEGEDERPMVSLMPQVNTKGSGSLGDLASARVWRDHIVWRAGASILKTDHISIK